MLILSQQDIIIIVPDTSKAYVWWKEELNKSLVLGQ